MASSTPLVLEGISLPDLIEYVLDRHAQPSTLVVCSTKQAFLDHLQVSFAEVETKRPGEEETRLERQKRLWSIPTLRLLTSSRTVKLVFCAELPQLRAYLAAYSHHLLGQEEPEMPPLLSHARFPRFRMLVILNLIALHRPTSSFSAQGITRTLAVAVEAAHQSDSRLILAECPMETTKVPSDEPAMFDETSDPSAPSVEKSWDEEVSILNVTTKSFGAGERGWVGRTVKVRAIAGRWCEFQKMDEAGV